MKKILSVLLALAMVLSLAACGGSDKSAADNAAANAPADTAVSVKVGVLHIGDPADGSGYSYTHQVGIDEMKADLGLSDDQVVLKINVSDSDATAITTALEELVEEGCNIIFATSYGYMDYCEEMAEKYPNVLFSHGTGYKSNGTNMNNYFGNINEARYLSGIAAGMNTTSNKIGYVAAWGTENGEVTSGIDAFAMGVYSVNPDATVYVKSINSWYDPEGETQAAQALLDMGCDVLAQHCDTANPQLAAEKAGAYGVGYNSDMSKDAPAACLTSVVWDWGAYYTYAVKSVMDGTWVIGEKVDNYYGNMADGLVDVTALADFAAEGTAEAVEAAKAEIVGGKNIWADFGPLVGNDGETHTTEFYTDINWYYQNVQVA